ncbi:WhiB family transcriptional regulator [Knoellia sp. CPCC 206450]|uniref:WhiB family transcriptional regulator n=1 Tax=Knoellia tibetensis TaxID=3404798 RepID=UPI003B430901
MRRDRDADRLPKPLIEEYEWQDQGRCRTLSVAAFFDFEEFRGRERTARSETAKAICRGCPVRVPCLHHALAAEDFGVWGGTTASEREVLRSGGPVADAS